MRHLGAGDDVEGARSELILRIGQDDAVVAVFRDGRKEGAVYLLGQLGDAVRRGEVG